MVIIILILLLGLTFFSMILILFLGIRDEIDWHQQKVKLIKISIFLIIFIIVNIIIQQLGYRFNPIAILFLFFLPPVLAYYGMQKLFDDDRKASSTGLIMLTFAFLLGYPLIARYAHSVLPEKIFNGAFSVINGILVVFFLFNVPIAVIYFIIKFIKNR